MGSAWRLFALTGVLCCSTVAVPARDRGWLEVLPIGNPIIYITSICVALRLPSYSWWPSLCGLESGAYGPHSNSVGNLCLTGLLKWPHPGAYRINASSCLKAYRC